ncbi:MAG: LysR family transcriptional regulator [Enterocloster sp.]
MKINQMEYFAEVCRVGSVTRAARELHISQPSVTAAIHEMEKELNVNLFLRRNNKLQLTEEGAFVLERVKGILMSVDCLNRDLKDFIGQKNHIRLGVPLQIGAFLLPLLFGKFRVYHPDIHLEIHESGAIDIIRNLMDDQLDMAILSMDTSRKWDLEWTHLYDSEFCFCVAADHPLASRTSISFVEACRNPLVTFKEGFYINQRVNQRMEECGVTPDICMETEQLHTIKNLVIHGSCGAFLLKDAVCMDSSIRSIPLENPMTAEIGLLTRRGKVIYNDAKTLISFIKKEFKERIKEENGK